MCLSINKSHIDKISQKQFFSRMQFNENVNVQFLPLVLAHIVEHRLSYVHVRENFS